MATKKNAADKAPAKKPGDNSVVIAHDDTDEVDDLLGPEGEEDLLGPDKTVIDASIETAEAKKERLAKEKADKKAIKDKEKADKKAEREKIAAEKKANKPERVIKGTMVTFANKAGEVITGHGVLYYVVRMDGKLHYKESTACKIMTEEEIAAWKETQKKSA